MERCVSPLNSPSSECYSTRHSSNPVDDDAAYLLDESPPVPTFLYRFDDLPPRIETMLMSACTKAMLRHINDAKVEIRHMHLGRNATGRKSRLLQIERELIVAETMNIDVSECRERIERLNWIISEWETAVEQEFEFASKKRRLEEELEIIAVQHEESNKKAKAWSSEFSDAAAAPWEKDDDLFES